MNYRTIILCATANGEGIRTSLFVSGCHKHCQGCFNQEAQDFDYGNPYTTETKRIILEQISKPYVAGLSLLGGDPLYQDINGLNDLCQLCQEVHKLNKNIWLWTGYTWEEIMSTMSTHNIRNTLIKRLISECDIVVDGPFIESQKDLRLAFRGSSNQRIIDVKKSLTNHKVILYNEYI